MRYLKKFENSSEDDREVIMDYIDECFINLIESDGEVDNDEDAGEYVLSIDISYNGSEQNNISDIVNLSNRVNEKLLDAENCIDKVKLQYPDIKYMANLVQNNNDGDPFCLATVFTNIIYITFYI